MKQYLQMQKGKNYQPMIIYSEVFSRNADKIKIFLDERKLRDHQTITEHTDFYIHTFILQVEGK